MQNIFHVRINAIIQSKNYIEFQSCRSNHIYFKTQISEIIIFYHKIKSKYMKNCQLHYICLKWLTFPLIIISFFRNFFYTNIIAIYYHKKVQSVNLGHVSYYVYIYDKAYSLMKSIRRNHPALHFSLQRKPWP